MAQIVDGYVANADYFEGKVKEHPKLEMMSSRGYANVNYRYNPTLGQETTLGLDALNEINIKIRNGLLKSGKFMIGRANIGDYVILRPVFCNDATTRVVFDALLAKTVELGDEFTATQ